MAMNGVTRIFAGAGHGEGNSRGKYRGGLYRLALSDGAWQEVTNGLPEGVEVRAIAVHSRDSSVIYAGTQDGPYRSTDGGDRWERLGFPDRNTVIWTLAIHPTRPNVVYAGAAPVALYSSEDGGDNWRKVPGAVSPAHCERAGFDTRTIRITFDPNALAQGSRCVRCATPGARSRPIQAPRMTFSPTFDASSGTLSSPFSTE